MNPKEFVLQQSANPDTNFKLQKTQEKRHFPIDRETITAYGLFSIGMMTLIGSGATAIGQFTPIGQIIGWSGVAIGSWIALKGAYKIGDLKK